ncbi:MAG: peptidase dimerization domain-containing protein [Candidatus Eisenbacteria bacterium]
MSRAMASTLDAQVVVLAARDRELAAGILREAIRIPADFVERPADQGGDPRCGLSNHEGPRLEYLRRMVVEAGAVRAQADVGYDAFGNLVWTLEDPGDGMAVAEKRVVMLDGHCDTVRALRPAWREKIGPGIDAYLGLTDPARVDRAWLRRELSGLPPDAAWEHLVFGRGAADQLAGVVAQIAACRILRELTPGGALRGVIVRAYATVAEEDNDGGGPMHVMRRQLPGAPPERIPDVVVLTEPTGDVGGGALGIYRGQRGRMQIEVRVTGRSCHGAMPWEGLNPLEHGGAIVAEAAARYHRREGFLDHPFLGHGTRTASFATLETPSDCAVPERFTVRFDRRLTVGETPERALADIEALETVRAARQAGLSVEVVVPTYDQPTWKGATPGNPQIYPGWLTPEEHPALLAALATYRAVITPHVSADGLGVPIPRQPRLSRWIFSTDGVGIPVPADDRSLAVPDRKAWVTSGAVRHPAMFGLGPGLEQNAHRVGEFVDLRELAHAVAFLARFPSLFAAGAGG